LNIPVLLFINPIVNWLTSFSNIDEEEVKEDKYHRAIISEIRDRLNENGVNHCYKDTSFGFYKHFLMKKTQRTKLPYMLNESPCIN
jgi:hypothetical protein